jgi:outer membrane lipoprotein-sorting protein
MITIACLAVALQQSNDEAEAIHAKLVALLKPVKTLSGAVEVTWGADQKPTKYTFQMMKPNFLKMESKELCFYIDGKFDYAYMVDSKEYNKAEAEPDLIGAPWLTGFETFLGGPQPQYVFLKPREDKYGGKEAHVLRMDEKGATDTEYWLYLDKATSKPLGWEMRFESGEKATGKYSDIEFDKPMKAEDFLWKPPSGAKQTDGGSARQWLR